MSLPTYDQLIDPLLRLLCDLDQPLKAEAIRTELAKRLRVSREELLPSGIQPVFDNRVGWAHDRLKRAGLSRSVTRGTWQVTEAGRAFAAKFPKGIPQKELDTLCNLGRSTPPPAEAEERSGSTETAPAEVRLRAAVAELRVALRLEVLDRLKAVTPGRFEHIVLDVLKRMGYGLSDEAVHHTGQVADGGIDGIIHLDKLGLQKVYVQAKRYAGTVGRPQIQAFYGALSENKAQMGVLITTGTFTRDAEDSARKLSDRIVLVDGTRLAELMMDHGAGVSEEELIRVHRIDSDYFVEE